VHEDKRNEKGLLPAGALPVTGREAIREHLSDGPPGAVLTWKPLEAKVSRAGDLGHTYGTYELRFSGADGKLQIRYGKYVSIWKRQIDGTWKFVVDIGNASPPPENSP